MVFPRIKMCDLCAENPAIVTEPKKNGGLARYCKSCWDTEKEHIKDKETTKIKAKLDIAQIARNALDQAVKESEKKE